MPDPNSAGLRLCRRTAAALLMALAESDATSEQIAARLQRRPTWLHHILRQLIDGKEVRLDVVSDIAFACGAELAFSIRPAKPLAEATKLGGTDDDSGTSATGAAGNYRPE